MHTLWLLIAIIPMMQAPKNIYNYDGGPNAMPLWPSGAPGAMGKEKPDIPTITRFDPPSGKANGASMVVCPGGGYGFLASHEGPDVAEWLNTIGVTAFVLKYRLGPRYHHPAMLGDAQRAIRTVRAKAEEWKLDPHRIGILGFSAGGHLPSSAVTHFDDGAPASDDPIERVSCRPDLGVLVYPVITLTDPFGHKGSRTNLLGPDPSKELIDFLSSEKQVTPKTPPCFLVHTADDAVPVENSMMFVDALRKAKVPFEIHIYEHGVHGYGLAPNDPILSSWPKRCADWFRTRGFIPKD